MLTDQFKQSFDVIGVGIGPANLSLAALLDPHKRLRACFLERAEQFQWHPGLLFPDSQIQVSYLKDLVTLVDPTSRFTFLSFLHQNKRLYRFINANFSRVRRCEFNQYYQWVCNQLETLKFGQTVEAVTLDRGELVVEVGAKQVRTRHLVLGTGLRPSVPQCVVPYLGETIYHASQYLNKCSQVEGKRVVVIGGGQTGAEIVLALLSDSTKLPRELFWISRRTSFFPLDESPFTNELFTPSYSNYFFGLPEASRMSLLADHKLAGKGIAMSMLSDLSQRFYELEFLHGSPCAMHLLPGRTLTKMSGTPGDWHLEVQDLQSGVPMVIQPGELVILCTGYNYHFPKYLEPIANQIYLDNGHYQFNKDFSIVWNGAPQNKIYIQNGAKHAWGIADPHLSLMAWRSAKIANSLLGQNVYDTEDQTQLITW